jgi:hypothetical protein
MAGSWIRMRHDLIDAPEIRRLARAVGVTKDDVYGKLFRLWSWFDRHSVNGVVADEELEAVDELIGVTGFAAALVSVGWLASQEGGIVIPHWDRHNSETAKERGLAAVRQERHRGKAPPGDLSRSERDKHAGACNAGTVTRLEKTREDNPPPPPIAALPEARAALRAAWKAAVKAGHAQPWNAPALPQNADQRLSEPGWLDDAKLAIGRLPSCRYFDQGKATLHQLCGEGFVTRVLGGLYDNPKPAKAARGSAQDTDKAPPRVWTGPEEDARRRMLEELKEKQQEATA